ncbi:hypothetical protein RR48_07113 [Papilio machaon]|uniref:Uncharacterized protein n=1 Tax=Papilio machaon TaxID=76193 RepID=A0A194RJW3_PAPMA|nr:hypothetical protein RR48_07113 [Papilio machaon]
MKTLFVAAIISVVTADIPNFTGSTIERSTHKRQTRSVKEDAGFTHDANTCKQYNSNLITLWSNLSKYIGTSEKSPPNKSVLHNIGIMIKAYLEHVTPIEVNTEAATEKIIIRKERNNPVVKEIKTNLDVNKINEVNALTDFILDQVKNIRIDNIKEECNKIIQNQIATLMNMAFKKYLLYNCNNIYNNAHSNVNVNILNSMPLNNQGLNGNLQHSSIPKIEEVRFDHNLLKVVKRSIETATNIDKNTHNDLLTEKDSLNSSISNNITKNETLNSSNEKQQQNSFQNPRLQSRRALQLNGKYCADLALDQFILTVKLILRLYLLNDDCTSGASKFIIISKLIEATPILEPFNENNLDYLSKYHVLLKLLDNMETEDMTNLFSTPKADVLQNKNTLEEFLHDVNNLAVSINYKQREKNNIANNGNDSKQQLLNSLYNYQQLAYNRNDGLLNSKIAVPFSVNVGYNAIVPNNPNKINKNLKEFQGMYTGVPINQNIEANRSVIYAKTNMFHDTKPNTNGATINSGNKFELNLDKTAPKNLNYLSTSNSKSEVIPATIFSASENENSILNPIQYKLIMNYSETFPTSLKGNLASLSSFAAFPYLNVLNSTSTNMNPLENTLLNQNLASNPSTLYNYFSKFAKNNNPKNQLKISPPVPNNIDSMNLLTANNNKIALNSNFNTKSELTINESSVKKYLHNPALVQQNSNTPSVNSGVHYYNLINNALTNNMDSNLINNLKLLGDNNLVKDKILNPFNVNNVNAFHFMKPNTLRSNFNLGDHKNMLQSNNFVKKLVIKNPLRTLNIPQIQKTPIISTTDVMSNSSNGSLINRPLKVFNSSYIRPQPKAISGVPLKNNQSIEKTNQGLSKSLFINPYSYSAKVINKENEIEKYLNLENVPVLRSNLLRNQKLETKPSTIVAIDNLPTISSDPDANGDVELTYVFHHPQIVIYQPQVLVGRQRFHVSRFAILAPLPFSRLPAVL